MPFYTYRCKPESNTKLRFERQGKVPLVGWSGLIPKTAERKTFLGTNEVGQRLTVEQLLNEMGDNHNRIISDITPNRENELTLMSIEVVSCYSYDTWMPILLHMVQVTHDKQTDENNFLYDNEPSSFIRSFLYLRTTANGAWLWGPTGNVNAALLWPAAMKFFQQEIKDIGYTTRLSI